MGWYDRSVPFSELEGQTIIKVSGLTKNSDEVMIHTMEGNVYQMYHSQDCCESVEITDIDGGQEDILGGLVIQAEEVEGATVNDYFTKSGYEPESYTWTFYKIATSVGSVFIRWLGQSNGYYSESVCFVKLNKQEGEA